MARLLAGHVALTARDESGFTPLEVAASNGQTEVVAMIAHARLQTTTEVLDLGGWNALVLAASGGHLSVVQVLLQEGLFVDARHATGVAALHLAKDAKMAAFLIERGADVNVRDSWGATPLQHAASMGRLDVVQLLLQKGADVGAHSCIGYTALHSACDAGEDASAQLILAAGADVDATDESGNTPLMLAAMYGREATVRLLLAKGANRNVRNKQGHTALDYAKQARHARVAEVLRQHGGQE
jgi:ankyrin repeat protein